MKNTTEEVLDCPLSANILTRLGRLYHKQFSLRLHFLTSGGVLLADEDPYGVHNLPMLIEIRWNALREAVRWGEPFVFSSAPGLLSWVVPVVKDEDVLGGVAGGEVLVVDDPVERSAIAEWLAAAGARPDMAESYLRTVPAWPQSRPREAASTLYRDLYEMTGLKPRLLDRNRENAAQQRQIAEEIHIGKSQTHGEGSAWDAERQLLFLLRTGDRNGARRVLNKVLASIFLYSPRTLLVQARIIELIGYLIRTAMEDDPLLEPLMERHVAWIERLMASRDFETLCETTRKILDEFMDVVSPKNLVRGNAKLQKALSHIAANFRGPITLDELTRLSGLSRFHLSRLVRKATGRTIPGHVRQLRIREACRLLETTEKSATDIAYDLGFVDQSYFIKQFRAVTGVTPQRYRDANFKP